jgi:hypothetical protein
MFARATPCAQFRARYVYLEILGNKYQVPNNGKFNGHDARKAAAVVSASQAHEEICPEGQHSCPSFVTLDTRQYVSPEELITIQLHKMVQPTKRKCLLSIQSANAVACMTSLWKNYELYTPPSLLFVSTKKAWFVAPT